MSKMHVAASGPKARELVDVVLAEFDVWAKHAAPQAAGMNPNNTESACDAALYSVKTDLADHLVINIGLTLASWGINDV